MARRGEVFQLKRRLGFAAAGLDEGVVILQADPLNAVLPTVLVIPLDPVTGLHANDPTAIPISAAETGSRADQVAVTTQLRPIRLDHLAPGAVGKLKPATLAQIEQTLKLILDLP
jgi:mRNA-degrading endonuclease toxin of MazEF toxin-antitoxin module